jgi:hypothetical protein
MTGLTGNNAITGAGYRKNQPPYKIDQSLRFEDGSAAYLSKTFTGTPTLSTKATISLWWKRGGIGDTGINGGEQTLISWNTGLGNRSFLRSEGGTDQLQFGIINAGGTHSVNITPVQRDVSAWYHIVGVVDTTQGTAADRMKLYINGEQVTAFDSASYPAQDETNIGFGEAEACNIGRDVKDSNTPLDGYLAEVNFIDGQALTPASFGETLASTNQWVPLEYVGSYGTNGFYQKYSTPYGIEAFTTAGSHTWTCPAGVTSVEVLTVAGGGSGGGKYYAGGGGAGGVVHATDYAVTPGVVYDITVGAGGATRSASHVGNDGSNSVFNVNAEGSGITLTATGGGGGGYAAGSNAGDGRDGGSGGGGAMYSTSRQGGSTTQNTYSGTANVTGYGFDGGDGYDNSNNYPAGGGGGAGAVGASSSSSGAGGIGRQFTTFAAYGTDSSNAASTGSNGGYFAGGGGGAGYNNAPQPGGTGGGGTSARGDTGVVATAGLANTGGGGGGASHNTTSEGAAGGSGVVLISVDAGIGADSSGNGNNFSATNLVATDQVLDTPTLGYSTLNPLINSSGTPAYSEGNLVITPDGSNYSVYQSTIPVSSGKWYAEYLVGDTNTFAGVSSADQSASAYGSYWDNTSADFIFFNNNNGNKIIDGAATSYVGAGATVGQIVGVAIDLDGNAINFYINNSAQGSISFSGGVASASSFVFSGVGYAADAERWNFGQDSSFSGAKTAQGNGGDGEDFYYTPPTGYKALNTDNLDDPAIALPTDHFNTILYTGNGGTQALTGVGFAPDLFWNKNRTGTYQHMLYNTISGATKYLSSGETDAEATDTNSLTSFDSDGVTLGSSASSNATSVTSVGWNWKAGGTASSNGDGDITSSVSANTTAGFSILTFSGDSDKTSTVGHGLSQSPELIIIKGTSSVQEWSVWHSSFPVDSVIYLNSDGAAGLGNNDGRFDVLPTASVFTPGEAQNTNATGVDYVSYCFHSVESYSKVGSYTGNGATDGPFIYTGFRPAFIMVKLTTAASGQWVMFDDKRDPDNPTDLVIYANLSAADTDVSSYYPYDLLSNGFKSRIPAGNGNEANYNSSGQTYIYLAFAESPFKTSNAR